MAWRSREQFMLLKRNTPRSESGDGASSFDADEPAQAKKLPKHYYNADGEIDLRQVTGAEAYQFLAAQGMKLPIIQRSDGR